MAFESLPGDDPPNTVECKNIINALLELGGPPGLYSHCDYRVLADRAGIGLSMILTKSIRISDFYTTADSLRPYSMRVDFATNRRQCAHIAYTADTSVKTVTAVASKGLADGASLQSVFGQYSLEKNQGAFPNPLESKAATISAWNGLLVHLPLVNLLRLIIAILGRVSCLQLSISLSRWGVLQMKL